MASKIMRMSTIKQLFLLHKDGHGIKFIARHLGLSKNTVKGYLAKLSNLNFTVDELLKFDDPVLESCFHGGNPSYSDNRHDVQMQLMPYLVESNRLTKYIFYSFRK
jgi:hypothetical protein